MTGRQTTPAMWGLAQEAREPPPRTLAAVVEQSKAVRQKVVMGMEYRLQEAVNAGGPVQTSYRSPTSASSRLAAMCPAAMLLAVVRLVATHRVNARLAAMNNGITMKLQLSLNGAAYSHILAGNWTRALSHC